MIAIVGAMEIEVKKIQAEMTDTDERVISGRTFVHGMLNGCEAVVVQCGIGKVNAALCTEALLLNYKPEVVINSGVGGSLCDGLHIGNIAVGERVVQHDVDTTSAGDPLGLVSTINVLYFESAPAVVDNIEKAVRAEGIPMLRGTIASGDQFVTKELKDKILKNFDCISCEMEAGAIAQVCYVNGVDFGIIRSISDNADDSADMDYPRFLAMASDNAAKVAMRLAAMYA